MSDDPIEAIVAAALDKSGIEYRREINGLDFFFHSDRIAGQMAWAANVFAIQGIKAAELFARMIAQ